MLVPNPSVVLRGLVDTQPRVVPTIELWDAWLFAELDAELSLKRWWEAESREREGAFAAYRAALEREAKAAHALQVRLAGETSYAAAA
jgi:hypothetical protein